MLDWSQDMPGLAKLVASAHITPRTAQWFRFPLNYDPVWGPDDCLQRAETAEPDKIAKFNPFADLLSLLG